MYPPVVLFLRGVCLLTHPATYSMVEKTLRRFCQLSKKKKTLQFWLKVKGERHIFQDAEETAIQGHPIYIRIQLKVKGEKTTT